MAQGHLIVLSGPSGAGKGTIVSKLIEEMPHTWVSVSATTRAPREGEVDGVDYQFLTREEFENRIKRGEFLEWAEYDSNLYGTPRATVMEHINAGENVILEIEVKGAAQVKENMPSCSMVFVEPPSLDELEKRLRGRGTNSDESVRARLETAKLELEHKMEYDTVLVNDDLQTAVSELMAFVKDLDKDM